MTTPLLKRRLAILLCGVLGLFGASFNALAETEQRRQYTFAWQFLEGSEMAPRGGTTRGAEVELVTEPTQEWLNLQEAGLSLFERDRRAILAMAGEYRASFDFIEVAGFTEKYRAAKPYQSWGTEKVYVLEDRGDFISLQHMLVMSIVGEDGEVQGPYVTKHWRQDWQFEPTHRLIYRGLNTWQREPVPADQQRGTWLQSVYHVDDSPRYAAVAQWEHTRNYSSWGSEETWRPLPRREFSVRDDYDVLIGINRHTILPTGWVHEQQNNKVALHKPGLLRAKRAVLSREFGYNRYERITGTDFSAGDDYVERTELLWRHVRYEWERLAQLSNPLVLKDAPDRGRLFIPLFEYADQLPAEDPPNPREVHAYARRSVLEYLAQEPLVRPGH